MCVVPLGCTVHGLHELCTKVAGGVFCSATYLPHVSAVVAYLSRQGGGCLLTQCYMTTLLLGGYVVIAIPISLEQGIH